MSGRAATGVRAVSRVRPATPHLVALAAVLFAAVAASGAIAHGYKLGDISIGHMWAAPAGENVSGIAVYGPLVNGGNKSVRLLGASTPIAQSVRFRSEKDGDVRWWETLELEPGKPLVLAPWREHIWLSGLKQALAAGDTFALSLDFGSAGKVAITVAVERTSGDR